MTIKILDNCCSLDYLDTLKSIASNSENWNMIYPVGEKVPIEDKFPKLEIIDEGMVKHPVLAGLVQGLLLQIHEIDDQNLFIPEIYWCGISIKDKHKLDRVHSDYEKDNGLIKILGIINSDWQEEWGGNFFHDGTSNYVKPTSFCIFDPSKPHSAEKILTDKKRIAIDFTVFRDQQSLNNYMVKSGNK